MIHSSWFRQSGVFDYSKAPKEAQYVDDIWMNGILARAGVSRFVVPLEDMSIGFPVSSQVDANIDNSDEKSDEKKAKNAKMNRRQCNDKTLQYFSQYFAAEGILHNKSVKPFMANTSKWMPERVKQIHSLMGVSSNRIINAV